MDVETDVGDRSANYAGFWIRVWAHVIDQVLYLILALPVLATGYGLKDYLKRAPGEYVKGPLEIVVMYALPSLLILLFWIFFYATPGKMLCRLRIVDDRTGERPSAFQLVLRWVGYVIAAAPLLIGLVMVGLDGRKQGWHDKMAGTVVVRHEP